MARTLAEYAVTVSFLTLGLLQRTNDYPPIGSSRAAEGVALGLPWKVAG